eukprot:jgi/Mesvir1/17459/Mv08733-RA.1
MVVLPQPRWLLTVAVIWLGLFAWASLADSIPVCETLECPPYCEIRKLAEFSVRDYPIRKWVVRPDIKEFSFDNATRAGFQSLLHYISGKNEDGLRISMTAPVVTGVRPSGGPFCESSFSVQFFLPAAVQDAPPRPLPGTQAEVRPLGGCMAVRQFSGFARDDSVAVEAARLYEAILAAGMDVEAGDDGSYLVAQYEDPHTVHDRHNEILMPHRYDHIYEHLY